MLGVSNISFGLPKREYINTTFLTLAMEAGLDLPIINPNNAAMMGAVDAFHVLWNIDTNSTHYVEKYAAIQEQEKNAAAAPAVPAGELTIGDYVKKGLGDSTAKAVKALLETKDPLDIVNGDLIPALDKVGADFEKAGFNVIKEYMAAHNASTVSKGKIVLATVKGDVHDIGKNIVKTILENYGYTVIDLGKDVPPEKVVEAAREHQVKLVGLSALMTTTVASMEETIKQIRAAGLDCKVMVGGAVLTEEFADLAKMIFGE